MAALGHSLAPSTFVSVAALGGGVGSSAGPGVFPEGLVSGLKAQRIE